jgi:hypothetical protein
MKQLLQRVATFLAHVIDAPESAPDTVEVARDLEEDIVDAINGNYAEPSEEDDSDDDSK